MKKKIISAVAIISMLMPILSSCGKTTITQIKDSLEIELGDSFELDVNDCFSMSSEDTIEEDEYTIDDAALNVNECGSYEITIVFNVAKTEEYAITVNVIDTTAPTITYVGDLSTLGYIWTNDMNMDLSDKIETEDLDKVTVTYNYVKIGDVEVATEEVINAYLDTVKTYEIPEVKESTGTDESGDATYEEGFYVGIITASDSAGNTATDKFLVLYDTTAPSIEKSGNTYTVTDAFSGDFTEDDYVVVNADNGTTVQATDKAGNVAEETFETSSNNGGKNNGNNNGGGNGGNNGGGNNGGDNNGGGNGGHAGESTQGDSGIYIANNGTYLRFPSGAVYYGRNISWNGYGGVNFDALYPTADSSWEIRNITTALEYNLQLAAQAIPYAGWGSIGIDNGGYILTSDDDDGSAFINHMASLGYNFTEIYIGEINGPRLYHNGTAYGTRAIIHSVVYGPDGNLTYDWPADVYLSHII